MFSLAEKQFISSEIEKLLLSLKHPEMDTVNPKFSLRVDGKEDWSWADIVPNWTFNKNNVPGANQWNEISRNALNNDKQCLQCGKEIHMFTFCSEKCNSDYELINGEQK